MKQATRTPKGTGHLLITGASSGIGYGVALEMARRGFALALTARRRDALEQLKERIQSESPNARVEVAELDVTDYASIESVFLDLAQRLDGIDAVFANAGISRFGIVGRGKFEDARKTVETNLLGTMAIAEIALAYFRKRGHGHLIGNGSVAGFRGLPGTSAYCASKAGVHTLFEALRAETHREPNIHISILHPGFIDTPINDMLPKRPFVIPLDRGARIIARRIERHTASAFVPTFPWSIIARLLRILPTGMIAKMR